MMTWQGWMNREGAAEVMMKRRNFTGSRTPRSLAYFSRCRITTLVALAVLLNIMGAGVLEADAGASGAPLSGTGSSFAAPAISTWVNAVRNAPYSLSLSYANSNSGTGRYEFTNQTVDFAVSDIGYVGGTDATPPGFAFNFIPITAGGIAFMYNVPGLTTQLQLTRRTACALLTGGITNWDDPNLAAANPGVTLPNLAVQPVTESDSAGTNYVLEEWCIDEQPSLWAAFVQAQMAQQGGPTDGVTLSATAPNSNWPGIKGGLDVRSTTAVAGDVADSPGTIGPVQVQYAKEDGFDGSDPTKNVALVQNASGDYTGPTPVDAASALAYATQLPDGTHQLNFNGLGPNVYNPSTYSYLLTPTTGWSSAKGQTMSKFVDYALTLGQETAPSFGYAPLGLSLEEYGINAAQKNIPGAVAPTADEEAALPCGDLMPSEVQAGQTTPTCGVTTQLPPPNTPETPYVIALPVLALAGFGGVFVRRRRRDPSAGATPRSG
jgi:phosphate transport system substrate-binding protein